MAGFVKLFESILDSSIWRTDLVTRVVWVTMLAMQDRDHIVNASLGGLADRAKVPMPACRKAVKKLSSPDSDSRSKEYGGRRIKEVRGGWQILNGAFYRHLLSREDQNEKAADRMRRMRLRKRYASVTPVTPSSTSRDRDRDREGEGPPTPPAPPRFPLHCPDHADVEFPPKCGACKERREASEARDFAGSGTLASDALRTTRPALRLRVCEACGRRCMSDGTCPFCKVQREDAAPLPQAKGE